MSSVYDLVPPRPTYGVSGLLQAFLFNNMPYQKGHLLAIGVSILCFYVLTLFGETPNRRETQFHAGKLSKFVMNSHIDPTDDQNDVQ